MNIYTPEGWLDVPKIYAVAVRNGVNFIVIIGKRQVGKTYGVLKFVVDEEMQFVLMRLTTPELKMLKKNVNNPLEKIYPNEFNVVSESDYTAGLFRYSEDEKNTNERIGMICALSTIGKIRGFNGDMYTDLVIDEFIPELHLYHVRDEGDAFLNAYTTINGNRELEGRPALRCWLLANSNNIDSDILRALNIDKIIERMIIKGEESVIIKERGIMVLMPESKKVTEKRKKGALAKAIDMSGKFAKMAYDNEFSYNDFSDVGTQALCHYNALVTLGDMIVHISKSGKQIYITERYKVTAKYEYPYTDAGIRKFNIDFGDLRAAFNKGRILFQSQKIKNYFLQILGL